MSLEDRINPHILDLSPYEPGKPLDELEREYGFSDGIKLASNENPLGPSPRAVEALRGALADVHRYPDGASFALREAMARHLGVDEAHLIFGCGSDELLELLAKVLMAPGDELVFAWPSFAMYPIVAKGCGARSVQVPLTAGFVHDLDAMADAVSERTKAVVVCNPNNPTGTSVGADAFAAFVDRLPAGVVLVIDEAYVEYARRPDFPDALACVRSRPRTITLRTFSKIYGLAGLRIGYGVGDPELVGFLHRARHPFNVNRLAEVAALAALSDEAHVAASRRANDEGMTYLERELDGMGIETWPSDANFVLARAGAGVFEKLLREGVIVRPMKGFGLDEFVRITIGTAEENERLVKALRRIGEGGG